MCQNTIPFLRLNNIPLLIYAIFCLSIHLLVDIWIISTFWLMSIMLQWKSASQYLVKSLLSVPLGIGLLVELLSHMIILCLLLTGTARLFLYWLHYFKYPSAMHSNFSTFSPTLVIFRVLKKIIAILVSVKWWISFWTPK